ncbi:TIGR01777 family oxidoreductase [Gryllotalpicola sp.]|uniref:TIGR01777 family oxidoreductase n=1 Tax=Gryllotalpicola sp. TaxID=1932787 RepID=UPI002620AACD|nr:TIGR01777 family oxidoreductase [Gryllotalpicola sp.]
MRIVIAGASGLIGTELSQQLAGRGDEVIRLVRHPAERADEVEWDPARGQLDASALSGADAVVNLAGESVSRIPWTGARRAAILGSRLATTGTVVATLHELARRGAPLPALVNASAVGYYGSRPGETLTEGSASGTGFLADVARRWEAAALAAPEGTRVVLARTGTVIAPPGLGGAAAPLRLIARLGAAGPIGTGHQHWPWISLHDEAAAFAHLVHSNLVGPVNLAGPTPATAADVVRQLAESIRRPYWLPLPAWAVTTLLGDAGRELLLGDQLERPEVLLEDGFRFRDETIADAVQ